MRAPETEEKAERTQTRGKSDREIMRSHKSNEAS